ncbi:MAG TPA: DUF2231 domain-containing protein [Pyrinomonadaceae bacterium]|nr:DUF2231 domain-containing protein [Pyrinomonadaceae bacterium]
MASRASVGGHPIHPALIPFPIGLLVFSFIADLIYLWRGNPIWKDYVAFYTLLAGTIGGAAAAIPGLIDWASLTDPAAVKVANWHARMMVITLLIFGGSFFLRTTIGSGLTTGVPLLPIILSAVGVLGLSIGGYLGGELVFRHGVAVSEQPKQSSQPESQQHIRHAA